MALTKNSQIDLNGNEMILDADGDTTITADTDDQIDFKTAGTDRVQINSTGDFLVRQTSADVYDTNSGGSVRQYWGNQFSAQNNTNSRVIIGSASNSGLVGGATVNSGGTKPIVNSYMAFTSVDQTAGGEDGIIAFYTSSGGAAGTERMRINSSGHVSIGYSGSVTRLYTYGNSAGEYVGYFQHDGNNNDRYGLRIVAGTDDASGVIYHIRCDDGDGHVLGYLQHESGTLAIQQASDERLKENIVDSTLEGINTLKNIRQREFNLKRDTSKTKIVGYIAQEMESVYPAAISVMDATQDGSAPEDDLENPYKTLSKTALIDVLIKATQEQQTIIEALKARIETLEGS